MSTVPLQFMQSALCDVLEEHHKAIVEVVGPLTDEQLWRKPLEPGNSVGHLILHLSGNLNHFVGRQLGHSDYVRDRDREFNETEPPHREELLSNFADAVATFRRVVDGLTPEQLAADHPEPRLGNVSNALVHLVAHFALHRGQMSYIVRLV